MTQNTRQNIPGIIPVKACPPERELYLPSNGSEGDGFMESWCAHCARDKPWSEGKDFDLCDESEVCRILGDSFLGPVDEWVYGDDGTPQCTAFVRAGDSIPAVDTLTMDMFVEEQKAD